MDPIEYAPTYSTAERRRFVVVGGVLGILVVGAGKAWGFPWIAGFSATAACRTVLGINGATVLWYALFVALPLLGAVVAGFGYGRTGLRILREGRFPPAGTQVFRPTRVIRSAMARRIGYLHLAACIPFLALATWGFGRASSLSKIPRSAHVHCAEAEALGARGGSVSR
jgi:hypothetical protein